MLKVYADKHVDLRTVRFEPILGRIDMLYLNFPIQILRKIWCVVVLLFHEDRQTDLAVHLNAFATFCCELTRIYKQICHQHIELISENKSTPTCFSYYLQPSAGSISA